MQVEHPGTGAASGWSMERGVIKMQQGTIQDRNAEGQGSLVFKRKDHKGKLLLP